MLPACSWSLFYRAGQVAIHYPAERPSSRGLVTETSLFTFTRSDSLFSPSSDALQSYTPQLLFIISLQCSHILASQVYLPSPLACLYRVVRRLSRKKKGLCHSRVYTVHEVRTFPVCFSTNAAQYSHLTYYYYCRLADDGPRQSLNLVSALTDER